MAVTSGGWASYVTARQYRGLQLKELIKHFEAVKLLPPPDTHNKRNTLKQSNSSPSQYSQQKEHFEAVKLLPLPIHTNTRLTLLHTLALFYQVLVLTNLQLTCFQKCSNYSNVISATSCEGENKL